MQNFVLIGFFPQGTVKPTSKEIPYQSIDTCSHGFKSLQLAQIIENTQKV